MNAPALTLARIAVILGLNALTALFAGDTQAMGRGPGMPLADPASLQVRPIPGN